MRRRGFCWLKIFMAVFFKAKQGNRWERHGSVLPSFHGCWVLGTVPPIVSLRSKRSRSVSEQRKTEEWDSQFWTREKWNKSQKIKVGGGGGEVSFLSSPPLLALLLAPFFAPSLTLVPRSLLLNRTETLATQANLLLLRIFSARRARRQ